MNSPYYLFPTWSAPPCIKAVTTLRTNPNGHSQPPYNNFNLATTVGDDPKAVLQNRQQLQAELNLLHEPAWIKQVHGTHVVRADALEENFPEADASWTHATNVPCTVLTADCLPLLLCHRQGLQVAAIHAGWRGLGAGIIEATLDLLEGPYQDWLVWLGPAIGPTIFEVGEEVYELFTRFDSEAHLAFKQTAPNKWLADIYLLARQRLLRYGVTHIYGGEYCTYTDAGRFYSYRRDGEKTGRMASLIWIAERCN